MPHLCVITLFPKMITESVQHGLLGQAFEKKLLTLEVLNPRDFSSDKHRRVDDRPFGGGDGMVMLAEPLEKTLRQRLAQRPAHVIYLSPQGVPLTTAKAASLSQQESLILLCGRYGGVDQRLLNEYVDEEISIGDYVLCGGELAALVLIEALARFVPGVLGHEDSAAKDSFGDGLLEHPHFTRPRIYGEAEVPEALLSGNHASIEEWKKQVSLLVTYKKRPDLFFRYIKFERKNSSLASEKVFGKLRRFYEELSLKDRQALDLENMDLQNLEIKLSTESRDE